MSLFHTPTVIPVLDCDPFVFCETERGFVYPLVPVAAKSKLKLGRQIPLNGMFELFELNFDKVRVGYLFKSSFTIENGGGYLVAYLKNRGLAKDHEVLLKLDTLVIYNFPNKGTLAVSPKVGEHVFKILESQ